MAASVVPLGSTRLQQRLLTLPARAVPPAFLATAAVLSIANRSRLRAWGWTPLDHHGVPWPSSLALLPGGRLQTASFFGSGASLIALARTLPRGGQARLLATAGAGLLAAALPLDHPDGDPGELASWVHSWHAGVHVGGFLLAGPAGILAIAASRRRTDAALAAALTAAAAAGRTPGWYVFLAGFFGWVWRLADRVARGRPVA